MGFLSRRRYEVLALLVAALCGGLNLWLNAQPEVGAHGGLLASALRTGEGKAFDLKFRLRGSRSPHPAVVVVAVDEKSAERYGLWPWPRARVAQVIHALHKAGAGAIGLDMTFNEVAAGSGAEALRGALARFDAAAAEAHSPLPPALADYRASLERAAAESPDQELAQALLAAPEVVQGVITYGEEERDSFSKEKAAEHVQLATPFVVAQVPGRVPGSVHDAWKVRGWSQEAVQTPLPLFAQAAKSLGYFNIEPDSDGTLRRIPLVATLKAPPGLLPHMTLQTAAVWLGGHWEPIVDGERVLRGVRLRGKERTIEVPYQNEEPYALVNHQGPPDVFPTVSIVDLLDGRIEPERIKGKAVLLGVTLVGSAGDQRVTPFKDLMPGVFFQASVVSNLLQGDVLVRPFWLALVELLSMVVLGLCLARFIPRTRSFALKGVLLVLAACAWGVADFGAFVAGVHLMTLLPLTSVLLTSFGVVFMGYLSVDREKLKLRSTFSRYLGADVMEQALADPDRLNRGEKREMTVLFSDIRGFTTLSERMLPEKLAAFIKEYLTPMTQIVFDEKGTLDKYIGDAIMAFWNAPLDQPDHALRACRAALAFLTALDDLKRRWRAEGLPEFDIGVGINTGPMIVGNMGSTVRVDYTVMGDAVNLASRLEGTNKDYDTRIILSESTHAQVKDQVSARRLGVVRVKGKRRPVRIYELRGLGAAPPDQQEAIGAFEAALDSYIERRWDEAEKGFQAVLARWPDDPPSRRYLEEIGNYKEHPPGPTWDGVYVATAK